jgi:hypothetical protein
MLDHIKRIIDSCETFDQVQTCTSFVKQPRPGIGLAEKQQILCWIREKENALSEPGIPQTGNDTAPSRETRLLDQSESGFSIIDL